MNTYIILVVIIFIIMGFGFLFGLFLYFRLRKKPQQWKAHIFEPTKERLPNSSMINKNNVYEYGDLFGLVKIGEDIIEKLETKDGKIHYWLKRAEQEINSIGTSQIINQATKEVFIIHKDGEYVISQVSVNPENILIFESIPHDVKNLMRSEITLRQQKYKDPMSIWNQLAPYIFSAIAFFSIVMIIFLVGKFGVDIYEQRIEHDKFIAEQRNQDYIKIQEASKIMHEYARSIGVRVEELRIETNKTNADPFKPELIAER